MRGPTGKIIKYETGYENEWTSELSVDADTHSARAAPTIHLTGKSRH